MQRWKVFYTSARCKYDKFRAQRDEDGHYVKRGLITLASR